MCGRSSRGHIRPHRCGVAVQPCSSTVSVIFSFELRICENVMGCLDCLEFRIVLELVAAVSIRMILER